MTPAEETLVHIKNLHMDFAGTALALVDFAVVDASARVAQRREPGEKLGSFEDLVPVGKSVRNG